MARRRMIDPAFWDDPGIGSLTVHARLLFISLISSADDEGRLEADGPSLRRTAFGFDDFTVTQVESWLGEIVSKLRSVRLYSRDGRRYVQLVNWRVFQAIDRPKASRLPAPDSEGSLTVQLSVDAESTIDRRLIDDGSFLKERKGKERKGREGKEDAASPEADDAATSSCLNWFDQFWLVYPKGVPDRKRGSKQYARQAFAKLPPMVWPEVVAAAALYGERQQPGYIRRPDRFLLDGFWQTVEEMRPNGAHAPPENSVQAESERNAERMRKLDAEIERIKNGNAEHPRQLESTAGH